MTEVDISTSELLRKLADGARWTEILDLTKVLDADQQSQPAFWFFRGLSLLRTHQTADALDHIRSGLSLNPLSDWGNYLAFEALLADKQVTEAFNTFRTYIGRVPGREAQKASYVQRAAELGLFEIAAEMNETREVILPQKGRPEYTLALQCFSKVDTLQQVLAGLITLNNPKDFALVVILDSVNGANLSTKHHEGHKQVKQLIGDWTTCLVNAFFSVEYLQNSFNLGTAPTCRRLLDHVTAKYAGFLFIEDDCVLAPSALDWTRHHLSATVGPLGPWFLTCELIFFDKEDRLIDDQKYTRLARLAAHSAFSNAHTLLDFVPSTCFGTTSDIWKLCAKVRSFTRGPESLSRFMAAMNCKTVAPIVPRASDIGMMHELGYSVARMGQANVREHKNTFIVAERDFDVYASRLYDGDIDVLYGATSKLNDDQIIKLEASLELAT